MTTRSLAQGGVYRSEREGVDSVETAFREAVAIACGGGEVEIVREGAVEVGDLSTQEMLGIIATIGDARARAATLITVPATSSPRMGKRTSTAEDYPPLEPDVGDPSTEWVWVLVRGDRSRGESVWVRYPVNEAPAGLAARPAQPPSPGSLGVVVMHVPEPGRADLEEFIDAPRLGRTRGGGAAASPDRNLVTVDESATALDAVKVPEIVPAPATLDRLVAVVAERLRAPAPAADYYTTSNNPLRSGRAFRDAARRGSFPSFKLCREIAAKKADVHAWIESRTLRATTRVKAKPASADEVMLDEFGLRATCRATNGPKEHV